MIALSEVRDYISSLGVAEDSHVYSGKLDNKNLQSIGVYNRRQSGRPRQVIGGTVNKGYAIKPISLLVHWNAYQRQAEKAAFSLWKKLEEKKDIIIGNEQVHFIQFAVPEPQDIGTDDAGIYEYVIWIDIYYKPSE